MMIALASTYSKYYKSKLVLVHTEYLSLCLGEGTNGTVGENVCVIGGILASYMSTLLKAYVW
jgi:hypothetical protein